MYVDKAITILAMGSLVFQRHSALIKTRTHHPQTISGSLSKILSHAVREYKKVNREDIFALVSYSQK